MSMKDVKELLRTIRNNEIAVKEHHDELHYAGILQRGLMPRDRHFSRIFTDSFLIYEPRNHVSGDFYWIGEKNGKLFFACADCTGHGVPAAMLSILGYSLLSYALFNADLESPSEILKKVDFIFIESFDFDGALHTTNDWIDISFCAYNPETKELTYCGANRKLLVIQDKSSYVLNGNRYPLGGWQLENYRSFEEHSIIIEPGAWVYLGSDGFQDQFGGNSLRMGGKKFGSSRLHTLLKSVSQRTGSEQKMILTEEYRRWKKGFDQTDDICLMGVQLF